jgi:hypothetical protein
LVSRVSLLAFRIAPIGLWQSYSFDRTGLDSKSPNNGNVQL